MKIKPLKPVFFAEAVHLEGVFPGPGMPAANAPTPQASIEDNSVHYPAGIELTVEKDASRQVTESNPDVHWFKNDEHPSGFPINKNDYEKISD